MALKIVTFPDGKSFSNRSADDVTDPDETGLADGGHDPGLLTLIEKTIEQTAEAVASGATASGAADTATAAAGTATTQAGIATTQAGIATTKAAEAAASAAAAAGAVNGVKVSSDDSTPGHLETKLLAGDGLVASTQNPGGAETRTFAVDPDLVLASPTVSTLLTVSAGMQSGSLYLGDVSGELVIEASDPLHIYCTIVGDTVFLVAGGTIPGTSHDHLIHWTMGGAGGYSVTVLPANLALQSEAVDQSPWQEAHATAAPTITANSAAGPRGDTVADRVQFGADGVAQVFQPFQFTGTIGQEYTFFTLVKAYPGSGTTSVRAKHHDGAIDVSTAVAIDEATWTPVGATFTAAATSPLNFGLINAAGGGADVLAGGSMLVAGSDPLGYAAVAATRAGQVVVQGTATDFPAMAAAATGDLGISIEPDGRIVVQDHTVEEL